MNLSDLLIAKKAVTEAKAEKTNKEKPKKEKAVKQAETKPTTKKTTDIKTEKKPDVKTFTAPFRIYLAAQKMDVSHIFEEGKSYTADDITKAMLQHGYYEFSGSVKYDLVESENILVPIFQQPKKG